MRLRETIADSCKSAAKYRETMQEWPEEVFGLRGRIASLALAPIKGLGMLQVDEAMLTNNGLCLPCEGGHFYDRMAMLAIRAPGEIDGVEYEYKRFSQRDEGALALAKPRFDGRSLIYSAPRCSPKRLAVSDLNPNISEGQKVKMKMFPDGEVLDGRLEREGTLAGVTAWVREMLKKNRKSSKYDVNDVEVIFPGRGFSRSVEDLHRRDVDEAQTFFTDGGQILTASQSTLDWMNADSNMGRRIGMEAFRPNIVVAGWPANIEDIIDAVKFNGTNGQVQMLFGGLSVRCNVTTVDNKTGEAPDTEPLTWLSRHRPRRGNKPTFAVNTVVSAKHAGRKIAVGDFVDVLSEKEI